MLKSQDLTLSGDKLQPLQAFLVCLQDSHSTLKKKSKINFYCTSKSVCFLMLAFEIFTLTYFSMIKEHGSFRVKIKKDMM
jgi:hypothetical protein